MRKFTFLLSAILFTATSFAQLEVVDTLTQIQMIEALEGPGVSFSNITVNCPGGDGFPQMAEFDGTNSNLGIDAGLVMASGVTNNTLNSNDDAIDSWFGLNNGDLDLDAVVSPDNTNDACVVEFDMKISGDTLRFNYVFGSEEYPEFVNSFNDVFAFFISGPGITGPFSSPAGFPNGSTNIAILPGTTTPVTINNINNGNGGCPGATTGPCMNCAYYVDNCGGTTVEYDGFTTKLTATIPVQSCETYHIKLAIADVIDGSYDSGVFLENGSFASAELNFGTAFTDVFEGCTEGGIDFNRKDTLKQDFVYIYFGFGGTALNGIDYGLDNGNGGIIPFPDSLILAPGTNSTTLNIIGNGDNIPEGSEEIVIYVLIKDCIDGLIPIDSITLTLHDKILVDLFPDTLVCPGEEINLSLILAIDTAAIRDFSFSANPDLDLDYIFNNITYSNANHYYTGDSIFPFSSPFDANVIFTISDTFNCIGSDTLEYNVLESDLLDFTYTYSDPAKLTVIDFINLSKFDDNMTYEWEFGDGTETTSNVKDPTYVFPDTGKYLIKLTATGDNSADCPLFKEIELKPLEVPNVITPNGDGINDFFQTFGLFDYKLTIFNRWGKQVYVTEHYKNTFNGADLNDGNYFYQISLLNDRALLKGWFQIMR